jgi:predicted GTPase
MVSKSVIGSAKFKRLKWNCQSLLKQFRTKRSRFSQDAHLLMAGATGQGKSVGLNAV